MKRRGVTVGRLMGCLIPLALVLWLVRPAITLLVFEGLGSHSHPRSSAISPAASPDLRLRSIYPGHDVHPNPFWPRYRRMLMGRPWPGDYTCPLAPPGTALEWPAWEGETISADAY